MTVTVQSVLKAADWSLKDLEEIVVNRGPGSLTGIRVGLAFSRSLALTLGIPLTGVSALDALAFAALSEWFARNLPEEARLVAVLRATAGQVFYAVYRAGRPSPDRIGDYLRAPSPLFLEHLHQVTPALVLSDIEYPGDRLPATVRWLCHPLVPTPEGLLQAARHLPDPAAEPLYLFPPLREAPR
jgi:tRNA threonylcarbamoyl adenosine modification protein YeaZ